MVHDLEVFNESEAIHAWLNYLQARYRADATYRNRFPTRAELEQLIRDERLIGAEGDAARAFLLPGAERVYNPLEVFAAWRAIDVTSWHRLRIMVIFTGSWARVRLAALLGLNPR